MLALLTADCTQMKSNRFPQTIADQTQTHAENVIQRTSAFSQRGSAVIVRLTA